MNEENKTEKALHSVKYLLKKLNQLERSVEFQAVELTGVVSYIRESGVDDASDLERKLALFKNSYYELYEEVESVEYELSHYLANEDADCKE